MSLPVPESIILPGQTVKIKRIYYAQGKTVQYTEEELEKLKAIVKAIMAGQV